MTPRYWTRACHELAARDPVLGLIIERHPKARLRTRGDAFVTLARSIVGQQISVKAAASVWARLDALCEGDVAPAVVAAAGTEALRGCGLSGRKVEYLGDMARRFVDGDADPTGWGILDDEALIAELTTLRGIGRWSAEMFLIFHLLRPDVLPLDDLGLQRAICLHYADGRALSRKRIETIARPWKPWRTVATWYLWRSLDPVPVEY